MRYVARDEMVWIMAGPMRSARQVEGLRNADHAALSRGVRLRAVYVESHEPDPLGVKYVSDLIERGGEVKIAWRAPVSFALADRKHAILFPDAMVASGRDALIVRAPTLIAMFADLFDVVWDSCLLWPYGGSPLEWSEKPVLQCLTEGLTDEVAARRLGVSTRTVRRHISAIMGRIGAQSRFELGVRLARMGVLDGMTEVAEPELRRA